MRAVLGRRVRELVLGNLETVGFFTPQTAYEELRRHLPAILTKRGASASRAQRVVDDEATSLQSVVAPVPLEAIADLERESRQRLRGRDEDDWPVVALALRLDAPIWTEDADFFGSGVATWTTSRIEVFFRAVRGD